MPFVLVRVLENCLSHATGELLAQRPDRRTHLRSGRFRLDQLGFQLIKPAVKALMELLA
jgi:hypothetical protein